MLLDCHSDGGVGDVIRILLNNVAIKWWVAGRCFSIPYVRASGPGDDVDFFHEIIDFTSFGVIGDRLNS